MLDGLEIGDKKLKVSKSETGNQPKQIPKSVGIQKYVKPDEAWPMPIFSMTPSRVIQFMNMIVPEDIIDDEDHHEVMKQIVALTSPYGEVLGIEIPRPDA